MEIKLVKTKKKNFFKELKLFKRNSFNDNRGSFGRIFCKNQFRKAKIDFNPKQVNFSKNKFRGTIRGMHYQDEKSKEAKLVTCLTGKILDVIVDIRKQSKNYLKYCSVILSKENNYVLYIPPGFAHGFQSMKSESDILYIHNQFFNKSIYRTLNPLDKKLKIKWPISKIIISKKDRNKKNFLK